MKNTILRFISLILAVSIMALGFVGCSDADTQSKPKTTTTTTTETIVTETDDGNNDTTVDASNLRWGVTSTKKMPSFVKDIKSNTLKIVTSTSVAHDDADKAAFKALTGIDIDLQYTVVSWGQLPERVAAMVLAGNGPDLSYYSTTSWLSLVKQPYWENLNDYIDFNDALWAGTATVNNGLGDYKGKRVGVFLSSGTEKSFPNCIMYNTELTEEASDGSDTLYDPLEMFYDDKWTWDALYEYVEEITDTKAGVYGICMPDTTLAAWIGSTGEDIIKVAPDKTLTYNLESANVTRALNFAKKIYKISSVSSTWEGTDLLLSNKCGFYSHINGIYALYATDKSIAATRSGKIKAVPFPRDTKSDTYYSGGLSYAYFLPMKSDNPWLAAAWLYYQRYASLNPSKERLDYDKSVYTDDYGWSEDLYALINTNLYKDKFAKLKSTVTTNCVAFGERLADFDQATYWKLACDPSVTTSTLVETVGPGLKEVITRYNKTN